MWKTYECMNVAKCSIYIYIVDPILYICYPMRHQAVVEVRKKRTNTKRSHSDEGETISVETRTTLGVSLYE